MTCHAFRLPDGTSGFVCTRGKRVAKCFYCNAAHTRLCDFVFVPGTTCSRKLCANHAYGPPGGDDFCPDHATAKPAPAVVTTLHVWTGTTYWHRSDPDALDVTIMTGGANGRPFAPSMAIFKPAMKARDDAERIEAVAALHEQTDPPKARELREEATRLELQTWAVYKRQYLAEMLVSSGRDVPEGWARDVALAKARGVVKHVEAWQAELARQGAYTSATARHRHALRQWCDAMLGFWPPCSLD